MRPFKKLQWFTLGLILLTFLVPIFSTSSAYSNHSNFSTHQSQDASFLTTDSSQLLGSNDLNSGPTPRYSVASEEENIDSFDVNPKSGRWDVTETGTTDDQIIDGNLRLISTENETSSSNEYFMERGLQKTDAKIDYRYKALMDNSSQVEYFRDVLGDSADFEEGDVESWAGNSHDTFEASNGLLKVSPSTDASPYVYAIQIFTGVHIPLIYHTIEIRAKVTSTEARDIFILIEGSTQNPNQDLSSTWTTYSFDVTGKSLVDNEYIRIYMDNDGSTGTVLDADLFEIDWIKFVGDLDYATHEASQGDTWDWEDSKEYFFDEESDVVDFETTTESFVDGGSSTRTNSWTQITDFLDGTDDVLASTAFIGSANSEIISVNRSGLSISASGSSGYDYLTFEMAYYHDSGDNPIDNVTVLDGAGNQVCFDNTGWAGGRIVQSGPLFYPIWHLFTCDLDLDGDWSSTENTIHIEFGINVSVGQLNYIQLNMVYLYDTALGDLEGWSSFPTTNKFVEPTKASLFYRTVAGSALTIQSPSGLVIDKSLFNYFRINIKASEVIDLNFNFRDQDNVYRSCSGSWSVATNYVEYIYDLTTCSLWISSTSVQRIELLARDSDFSNFEGDELIEIDYILLLSSTEQEQDFTLGFWDEDNNQALVNVTHHFFNSTTFRWEVELYDSNQEIASYYYSSNYTVADEFYRVEIDYDILTSEFGIKVDGDNTTEIFDASFGKEFTTSNDNPNLFSYETLPIIFLSTYTTFYGHQEVWIDFINAPYKEREWEQIEDVTDTDWLTDSWENAWTQNQVDDRTVYELVVPKLDSVSASLAGGRNTTGGGIFVNLASVSFSLYGISANNGSRVLLFTAKIRMDADTGGALTRGEVSNPDQTFGEWSSVGSTGVSLGFSCGLIDNRKTLTCQSQGINAKPATYFNASLTTYLPDFMDDPSQEFLMQIIHDHQTLDTGLSWKTYVNDFNFQFRNAWNNLKPPLSPDAGPLIKIPVSITPTGGTGGAWLGTIFQEVGKFIVSGLGAIFGFIFDALGVIFEVVGDALELAIQALEPLLTVISDAVDGLVTWLSDIIDELADLAAGIWTAIISVASDILDAFLALMNDVIDAIIGVASYLLDALLDLLPFGIGTFVRDFASMDIGAFITQVFDFVTWILTFSTFFLMIFLGLHMWGFPILKNLENPGEAFGDIGRNMLAFHGFDLQTGMGNITIPIRANAFMIWLILVIALGYLSVIWPGGALF